MDKDSEQRNFEELLKALEKKAKQPEPKYNSQEFNDRTRSKIALFLTRAYVAVIIGVIFGIPFYNAHLPTGFLPIDIKDALLAVSGIFGSTYGFVIGHYFKASNN